MQCTDLAPGVESFVASVRKPRKQFSRFRREGNCEDLKEKARRKKCDVRFSLIKRNRVFQKNYLRTGARMLLRTGFCESTVRTSRGHPADRKAEIEETKWRLQQERRNRCRSLSSYK